ncbi:MAG: carboxypeptidase regulatory-like domain-containing protein [Acidobacteria bacterium]|nr:carboxypeptidase regulatory-like domain-containing protein [Acidobacteriota bacterium]
MQWEIPNPFPKQWDELSGDGRERFHADCGKFVQSRRAVVAGVLLTTIAPLMAQDRLMRVMVKDTTGTPIKDAVVKAAGRELRTDGDGAAVFSGLGVGPHAIEVASTGFMRWRGSYNTGIGPETEVPVTLEVGSLGGAIEIATRSGQVRFAVENPLGGPVADAEVEIAFAREGKFLGRSDSRGGAYFAALPAGQATISITAQGFQVWRGKADVTDHSERKIQARLLMERHDEKVIVKESPSRRFVNWLTSCTRRKG